VETATALATLEVIASALLVATQTPRTHMDQGTLMHQTHSAQAIPVHREAPVASVVMTPQTHTAQETPVPPTPMDQATRVPTHMAQVTMIPMAQETLDQTRMILPLANSWRK